MSNEQPTENTPHALNKALKEAVNFIHAEGWDAPPTLFALVPTRLLVDHLDFGDDGDTTPLTLVVQDDLPDNIQPGTEELADYVSRIAWPPEIAGAILVQEIRFRDTADDATAPPRPARLFSGALRVEGVENTLLQIRPTEEELEAAGPFAEDDIKLRGGPTVAPGIIAALRHGFEQDPDDMR